MFREHFFLYHRRSLRRESFTCDVCIHSAQEASQSAEQLAKQPPESEKFTVLDFVLFSHDRHKLLGVGWGGRDSGRVTWKEDEGTTAFAVPARRAPGRAGTAKLPQ